MKNKLRYKVRDLWEAIYTKVPKYCLLTQKPPCNVLFFSEIDVMFIRKLNEESTIHPVKG